LVSIKLDPTGGSGMLLILWFFFVLALSIAVIVKEADKVRWPKQPGAMDSAPADS